VPRHYRQVFGTPGDAQGYPYRGTWGRATGSPLSKPFALEVRGDGTTVPATVVLAPRATDGQ